MKNTKRTSSMSNKIKIDREWAMPSPWTFSILPIKNLISRYVKDDG